MVIAVRVLFAELGKDKQLLVLLQSIACVLKMYARVQMVMELLIQRVPPITRTSVPPALVNFTRLVTLALDVNLRVVPEQANQLLALPLLIVYAVKILVLALMVLQLLELRVRLTERTDVCLVIMDIIKLATYALNVVFVELV